MPSHLTRQVFRRLLANEPILHRGCLRRQHHNGALRQRGHEEPRMQLAKSNGSSALQRRTAFNLASLFGKKREPAGASLDPGLEKMMELEKMTRLKARLPTPEQVSEALASYFRHARRGPKTILLHDTAAALVAQSLRYCFQSEVGREAVAVPYTVLAKAVRQLRFTPPSAITQSHVELGKALLDIAKERLPGDTALAQAAFPAFVRALSLSGSPQRALDITLDYRDQLAPNAAAGNQAFQLESSNESRPIDDDERLIEGVGDNTENLNNVFGSAIMAVLRGFVQFGPDEKVVPTLRHLDGLGFESPALPVLMQEFTLRQGDLQAALHWWKESRRRKSLPRVARKAEADPKQNEIELASESQKLLDWCLAHDRIDAGHQVVEELAASTPSKPDWDVILVWAAGTKRSVDEIDRMIGVMVQSNESIQSRSEWRLPDVATINMLVETAIARGDPYTAERFIALGRDRGIEPDAKTYVLQMNYRLQVGDIDGALIAYKNLQGMDLSLDEDIPTVNRLIVALCMTQRHDFETVMNIAADLSDRRARFEPETVATLSLLHLRRDERFDVIDLLNTHAYHFSSVERESIRKALIDFALDSTTPTSRSWDTYTILRELFDEMPRAQRTELMISFIRRERADMGVHLFQNMRMHSRADTMPTIDTYVAAFMALAKLRDLDNLEVVHNQLKLDFNVQPSTVLLNALIIAYTACGKPRLALDYWDEIAISREGPSYNSVHVALRACEKAPFGDLKAQEIWGVLRKRGVELDRDLWASYVAALAGNGDNELAFRALEDAVERDGLEVDDFVLGSLMAAGANKEKQEEMEEWARARFARAWEQLETRGVETDVVGMRHYDIDRSVAP